MSTQPVRQFSELSEAERQELRNSMNLRSQKEGTDLLDEVRCVCTIKKPDQKGSKD